MKSTNKIRTALAWFCGASLVTLATLSIPSVVSAQPVGRFDLAWLRDECARTSATDPNGVGKVDLTGELRDANASVVIAPPCLVRLGSNASVTLNNVRVRSRTLMFRDLYFPAGDTRIKFQKSTFTGDATAGFMIDLYDRSDQVGIEASTLDYPSGVVIRVHGNRVADLDSPTQGGGDVRVIGSTLRAQGSPTEGISLLTGANGGSVQAVNDRFESVDPVFIIAARCQINNSTNTPAKCSLSDIEADLAREANAAQTAANVATAKAAANGRIARDQKRAARTTVLKPGPKRQ